MDLSRSTIEKRGYTIETPSLFATYIRENHPRPRERCQDDDDIFILFIPFGISRDFIIFTTRIGISIEVYF